MKNLILILTYLFIVHGLLGQPNNAKKLSLQLSSGIMETVLEDRLLNYYTYKGSAFLSAKLTIRYYSGATSFTADGYWGRSRLEPQNYRPVLYSHNYIRHHTWGMGLAFHRRIWQRGRMRVSLGAVNHSGYFGHTQFFRSELYENLSLYRKSYSQYLIDLSPLLVMEKGIDNHMISLSGSYSLLMLKARPSDNFVKQTETGGEAVWKWLTPFDYKSARLSVGYSFNMKERLGLVAGYDVLYRTSDFQGKHRLFQHMFMVGLHKGF